MIVTVNKLKTLTNLAAPSFQVGRIFLVELEGRNYRCRFCDCSLALAEDVLSRSFNCCQGRAYIFTNVVNITLGPEEERLMLSGSHTVQDIFCVCCGQILGWRYVCQGLREEADNQLIVYRDWNVSEH